MSASQPLELRPSLLRRALLTLTACLGLGAATTGCYFISDNDGTEVLPPADPVGEEMIDTGGEMAVKPGMGAGLFVEYQSGGHWYVYTTCDTKITDVACDFDILVSFDASVSFDKPAWAGQHDSEDRIEARDDGSVRIVTHTSMLTDGVTFTATPGAPLTVDMLLDGFAQPEFVNWMSGGVAQQDAIVNPVRFTPTFE